MITIEVIPLGQANYTHKKLKNEWTRTNLNDDDNDDFLDRDLLHLLSRSPNAWLSHLTHSCSNK